MKIFYFEKNICFFKFLNQSLSFKRISKKQREREERFFEEFPFSVVKSREKNYTNEEKKLLVEAGEKKEEKKDWEKVEIEQTSWK